MSKNKSKAPASSSVTDSVQNSTASTKSTKATAKNKHKHGDNK